MPGVTMIEIFFYHVSQGMVNRIAFCYILFLLVAPHTIVAQSTRELWLDELPIQTYSESIRPVVAKANYRNDSLKINSVYFNRGLGVQSLSVMSFYLEGNAKRFTAAVGADDGGNKDIAVSFFVVADKRIVFSSGPMNCGDPAKQVDINLEGIQQLGLLVKDSVGGINNKWTNANWADAKITMMGDKLPGHIPNKGERYILTPAVSVNPKINSAKVFGATPGNPFLYTIAATGARPIQFSVEQLPAGLKIDQKTGIITGMVNRKGEYTCVLKAKNKYGETKQSLRIKIGDTIALTPPIGWNGWNAWASNIDREKVIASADAMVNTGLRDHGWTYINIDDTWQGIRGGDNNALQPNKKFPRFKEMVDYIHSLGLKAGLYSTPYISSYGGFPGASSDFEKGGETHELIAKNRRSFNRIATYRFEENDALQMAQWGFDFLKYDWRIDVNSTERMSTALKKSGRDIVYSLSNSAPFANAKDWVKSSNMFRTGPDIRDSWSCLYQTTFSLDKWGDYSGPGHWPDPDMMILGNVSTGPELHPTRLTPDEQYSHMSLFSLLAAPLLIGCPVEQLDAFTLNLLSNDEVIAINQDPLGKPGRLLADDNGVETWVKPLEDGSYAVGLFNIDGFGNTPQSYFRWNDEKAASFTFSFSTIGLRGKWKLRDTWRQKDLGKFDGSYSTLIPHHGVVLLRMDPVK